MARFLVDESLPRAVTRALVAGGHDVVDVRDIGLRGAPDADIASRAAAENRIVVSADLDFGNALRFASTGDDVLDGAITIVEVERVRIFSASMEP